MKMKTNKTFAYGFFTVIIALGILFTVACKEEPETITVEKDVTVTFPAFTSGTNINFAIDNITPDGGWGEHFSASDITYTVYCTELDRTYGGTGLTANISDGYTSGNTYTFTQTFKMDNTVIKSQIVKVEVAFNTFAELKDSNGTTLDPQAIPSILLHLEKTVTK
jgi:hypothetical protein